MAGRKNQGANKSKEVVDKYFKESGGEENEKFTQTVNWATSEEVASLKKPNTEDFYNEVKERSTSPISEKEIVIENNQKRLNLVFRNALNIRDVGNPQYGEENRANRKNLSVNIEKADPSENKVIVVYGGDLLGTEWELKHLNNAKIIASEGKNGTIKKALFYGLEERVKVLIRDIEFTLSHNNVEVLLLNGAQEHKINSYFKKDILQEVVDRIGSDRVKYVKGVNTILNVAKKAGNGSKTYATIGFQTNNMQSKAKQGQSAVNAVKNNSGENDADVVFVTNTNVSGKKGKNFYFVSSEAKFLNTSKGKFPSLSPKNYNTFSLNLAGPREFTVIQGTNLPKHNFLEQLVYEEMRKSEYIKQVLLENVSKEIDKITSTEQYINKDLVKTLQYFNKKYEKAKSQQAPEPELEQKMEKK